MARTHKGGGPPRQSQSAASGQLPSSASAGGAAGAGPSLSSAQRSPLKPDSTSSSLATGKQAEPPRGGRQTVVLDAAMIRALVGDDSSGRGRQGSSSKAAEVEHLGFKYKFKPSSITNQKPGTFTVPSSSASVDSQHAVVHLQGANKTEVHGFVAKVEEMTGAGVVAGRDVMLVWDESKLTYTMSPIARTYNLVHDKSLARSHLPTASPFEPSRVAPSASHASSTRPVSIPSAAMDVDVDGGLASSASSSSDSSMRSVGREAVPLPEAVPQHPVASISSHNARMVAPPSSLPPPPPPPPQPPAPVPTVPIAAFNVPVEGDPEADAEGSTDDDDDDDEDDDFAAQLEQELAALSGGGAGGGGAGIASSSSAASVVDFAPAVALGGGGGSNGRPMAVSAAGPDSLAVGGLAQVGSGRSDVAGKRPVSLNSLMGVADNESDSEGSSASSDSD